MKPTLREDAQRFVLGTRDDWHLSPPWIRAPRLSLHWLGPLAVFLSTIVSWFAFSGTSGLSFDSTFSMWVGAVSIVLMAWSFILALRLRFLERFWGGLDSMYRGHRWAGALAVVFMFLHTQIEPETRGAAVIAGASKDLADTAEGLAEQGELMLYGLIGLSLVRLIPYRWWRWTHKLFGIPFAFASCHFFTADKPYANGSTWGWYFGSFMVVGLAAFLARVGVRDTVARGAEYTVIAAEHVGNLTQIELAPRGQRLSHQPGQFAFLRFGADGMGEPHPFSIASGPSRPNLEFAIRHLGDWSDRLPDTDLIGTRVLVEGPYGAFEPISAKIRRFRSMRSGTASITMSTPRSRHGSCGRRSEELVIDPDGAEESGIRSVGVDSGDPGNRGRWCSITRNPWRHRRERRRRRRLLGADGAGQRRSVVIPECQTFGHSGPHFSSLRRRGDRESHGNVVRRCGRTPDHQEEKDRRNRNDGS